MNDSTVSSGDGSPKQILPFFNQVERVATSSLNGRAVTLPVPVPARAGREKNGKSNSPTSDILSGQFVAIMDYLDNPEETQKQPSLQWRKVSDFSAPTPLPFQFVPNCWDHRLFQGPTDTTLVSLGLNTLDLEKELLKGILTRLETGETTVDDINYYFQELGNDAFELSQVFRHMPKGETHLHLTGLPNVETWIKWAQDANLWFEKDTFKCISTKEKEAFDAKVKELKAQRKELTDKKRGSKDYSNTTETSFSHHDRSQLEEVKKKLKKLEKKKFFPAAMLTEDSSLEGEFKAKVTIRAEEKKCHSKFFKTFGVFERIANYIPPQSFYEVLLKYARIEKLFYVETSKGFEALFEENEKEKLLDQFPKMKSQCNTSSSEEDIAEEEEVNSDLDSAKTFDDPKSSSCSSDDESLDLEYEDTLDAIFADPIKLTKFMEKWITLLEPVVKRSVLFYEEYLNSIDPLLQPQKNESKTVYKYHLEPTRSRYINVDINRAQHLLLFLADVLVSFQLIKLEFEKGLSRVVGVVVSGPEDSSNALRYRDKQFMALDFLRNRSVYKDIVPLSLHAGELTANVTASEYMYNAIKDCISLAKPNRLGHLLCLEYEDDWEETVENIRDKIGVEICLRSNDKMFGKKDNHPILKLAQKGIGFTLNTDDPGVIGTSPHNERVEVYTRYRDLAKLTYGKFKNMERNHLKHGFARGEQIYKPSTPFHFDKGTAEYDEGIAEFVEKTSYQFKEGFEGCYLPNWEPSEEAAALLKSSPKARLQLDMERKFYEFERKHILPKMKIWARKKLSS